MAHSVSEPYINNAQVLKKDGLSSTDVESNFVRLYGSLYYLKNDLRKERLMILQLK